MPRFGRSTVMDITRMHGRMLMVVFTTTAFLPVGRKIG